MDHPDSGDETAFRELFNSTYPELVAYARRRSFNRTDADDAVGEVYAIAWRRRQDLRPGLAPLPWLYGIASNVLRNQWRADGRRLRLVERLEAEPGPAANGDPADGSFGSDGGAAGESIRAALGRLSYDDQEVLRLVTWEGLSHAEIGQVLDCSTNAVGIRLHRARLRLEAELMNLTPPVPTEGPDSPGSTAKQQSDRRRGGAAK